VVNFAVQVVGNPSAGLQQVWATYTGLSGELNGSWQSLDLVQNSADSTMWQGSLNTTTVPQDIRFIVQAVNGVGLTSFSANQGAFYTPDGFVDNSPQQAATQLALNAANSGAYANSLGVNATLTSGGNPVANELVWFGLGGQRVSGITNANGVAHGTLSLFGLPDTYELRVSFDGKPLLAASSATASFSLVKENTHLSVSGPSGPVQYSDESGLTATVRDAHDRALGQVTVAFVMESSAGGVSRTSITDLVSKADLGPVPFGAGEYNVNATFGQPVTLSDGTVLDLTDSRYNGSSGLGAIAVMPEDATVEYMGDTEFEAGDDIELRARVSQADDG
jgi:hypothetical protein